MKLIKKLDIRRYEKGYGKRWALFLCPYCDKEVEKQFGLGKRDKSCGCVRYKLMSESQTRHGSNCRGRVTKLYSVWIAMKQRCCNEKHISYKNYGGRGIKVCGQWLESYIEFKTWAENNGYKDNLQVDRRNNDKGYEPSNCRWITRTENMRNSRVTKLTWAKVHLIRQIIHNKLCSIKELAGAYNISKSQIQRIVNNSSWQEEIVYNGIY